MSKVKKFEKVVEGRKVPEFLWVLSIVLFLTIGSLFNQLITKVAVISFGIILVVRICEVFHEGRKVYWREIK